MLLLLPHLLLLLLSAKHATGASATALTALSQLTTEGELQPTLSQPVLEILHPPPTDAVLSNTDLHIEVAVRDDLHTSSSSRLCVSMDPVFVPPDVELEDGTSQLPETCFEHAVRHTAFHVEGLVPGLAYGLTAGLIRHARVVALSFRTFRVASVQLPELGAHRVSVAVALEAGAQLHNAGDRLRAARVYRAALDAAPDHPHALHLLGLVLYQDGRALDGLELVDRALARNASEASFHNSRGLCLKALGYEQEGIQAFRRALEINPLLHQAALNLGDALQALGKWEDALHEYRKVAASARHRTQDPHQDQFQQETPDPDKVVRDAWSRICALVGATDGWREADKCLGETTQRWPLDYAFLNDRGFLFLSIGRLEEALKEFEHAAGMGSALGMINVADTLEALGETTESLEQYQLILRSITEEHSHLETRIRLMKATVLPWILPETQQLIDYYRQRFESELDALRDDLENLHRTDMDPSLISFSTAVMLHSHNRNNRVLREKLGALYFDLLYRHRIMREKHVLTHMIVPLPYRLIRTLPTDPPLISQRRLRVGFVSRYLYDLGAGIFMYHLIPELSQRKYQTFAFVVGLSGSMKKQEKVAQIADRVYALPYDLLMARNEIEAAEVDILIYPEIGMDRMTYFLSLSRLAPVQAAWWGASDTSGVSNIDYRLVSEYEHENFREHYSEKKIFQFNGTGLFHSFPEPHDYTSSREHVRGAVRDRFGLPHDFRMYLSIESILSIHPDFDHVIGQILEQDEHACVFLLGRSSRNRWRDQLAARIYANVGSDLAAGRVYFLNDVDSKQELLLAGAADALMASLHVTNQRAMVQAITAGMPMVTLPGELWSSRVAYALYQQIGMTDLVATSVEEYVALVLRLARDEEFRSKMVAKFQERRGRLHEDTQVVEEWERFLDQAGSEIFPTTDVEDIDADTYGDVAADDDVTPNRTSIVHQNNSSNCCEEDSLNTTSDALASAATSSAKDNPENDNEDQDENKSDADANQREDSRQVGEKPEKDEL